MSNHESETVHGTAPGPRGAILGGLSIRRETTVEPDETGTVHLRHGRVFRRMVAFYVTLTTTLLALGCTALWPDRTGFALVAFVFGAMWLASLGLAFEVFGVELSADEDGVTRRNLLGRERRLAWKEVAGVRHSEAFHRLSFRAPGQRPLRVSLYRDGLGTLASLAEERLSPEVAGAARAKLEPRTRQAA